MILLNETNQELEGYEFQVSLQVDCGSLVQELLNSLVQVCGSWVRGVGS